MFLLYLPNRPYYSADCGTVVVTLLEVLAPNWFAQTFSSSSEVARQHTMARGVYDAVFYIINVVV